MANTLTDLTPNIFNAMDVVSREKVGFINAVSKDMSNERAAKDQVIRSFVTPEATIAAIVPGQLPPNTGDQTIASKTITISRSEASPIKWNGEEVVGMDSGPVWRRIFEDQMAQSMRKLINTVEADLAGLYTKASNSLSPDATTLFSADLQDIAEARKLLCDNGAPLNDIHMVLNTAAGRDLRVLGQLTKANEAASDETLREGLILRTQGFNIRESAAIIDHTKGDGTTAAVTGVEPVGETSLAITITDEIVAGDRITIAGDTNEYVVLTGTDGDGTIVIGAPGLKKATVGSDVITILPSYAANMAFSRNAIHLVTRAPAQVPGGDSAVDSMLVTDPSSGLTFDVRVYKEFHQTHWSVGLAWGFEVIKSEHLVLVGSA